MKKEKLFKDIQHLLSLGFPIHLLHPNSKKPIHNNWSKRPFDDFKTLRRTFNDNNIGVRLGKNLKSNGNESFLAVIDCDVKSQDQKHIAEMESTLADFLSTQGVNVFADIPTVFSGRGNGSKHVYIRTVEPVTAFRLTQSKEKVKVLMPSHKPSKNDLAALTENEIKKGYRVRAAWEISIMGEGNQVVLPPSIHPDTGALS